MKVNENTLKAYNNTSSNKSLRIYFPNLDYTIDKTQIHQETMFLREALIEGSNIEFVGCISSEFSIQIQSIPYSIKNEKMEVYIVADDTEEVHVHVAAIGKEKDQRLLLKTCLSVWFPENHLAPPKSQLLFHRDFA